MTRLLAILLIAALPACATISKVEGEQLVNGRLSVKMPHAWNKLPLQDSRQPFDAWTQEGLPLDQLRIWAAIKPGESLVTRPANDMQDGRASRVPTYTRGMAPDQLVSLFETLYSASGSLVTVSKVEPALFAGEQGVRFEFAVIRKRDDLPFRGVGWIAVRGDELYAATFVAPRLSFFSRLLPMAEGVVKTARIRG